MSEVVDSKATLTKNDIVNDVAEETCMDRSLAKRFVDSLFENIRITLENNQNVKISAFGNFELRDKNSRPGRNPKTGVEKVISERRVVTFKAGQLLKDRCNPFA